MGNSFRLVTGTKLIAVELYTSEDKRPVISTPTGLI